MSADDFNRPKVGLPNDYGEGISIEYAGNVIVMSARMWHDAVLGQSTKEHCLKIVDHRLQRSIDPGIRYALKCVAEDIRTLKHPTQEQGAGK